MFLCAERQTKATVVHAKMLFGIILFVVLGMTARFANLSVAASLEHCFNMLLV